MKNVILIGGALIFSMVGICRAQAPGNGNIPQAQLTADQIRAEATRTHTDAVGRALPLLSSWNAGANEYVPGLTPAYQIGLIEQGHHIFPAFSFPNISSDAGDEQGADEAAIERHRNYYEPSLRRAAELRLPITLVSTQWERLLSDDPKYFSLPVAQNPNVVTPEGKTENKVSPFGPVSLWREVGVKWASSPLMKQVQQWYPNPPQVILLSNNEHRKLSWKDVETDSRYLEKYGKGRDDDFKRKVVGDGWIERYRALQEGMRSALSPAWRDKVLFVGYDAFGGQAFGRWPGWVNYSLYTSGRFEPHPLMWDGATPSYYTDDWNPSTDYKVWSPQVESMNWVFMQKQALKLNPKFRFSFSIWDGQEFNSRRSEQYQPKPEYYRLQGQTYGPPRYAGYAQFGLWLLRPHILHEYRGHTGDLKSMEPYYLALAEAVDRVHLNLTLKAFWRKGELVPNRAHQHPYQTSIPKEYKGEDRWFLLDTNLDPPRPWKLETELPVFSLALVDGARGARRWIVYAHSPLQDRKNVEITVPGYGKITVDVNVAGSFYLIDERASSVRPIS